MKIYDYNGKRNICGSTIRKARKLNKMSQAELAARLQVEGVSIERDSISRIESGTRFVSDFELKTLAKILDVPIDTLLHEADTETFTEYSSYPRQTKYSE